METVIQEESNTLGTLNPEDIDQTNSVVSKSQAFRETRGHEAQQRAIFNKVPNKHCRNPISGKGNQEERESQSRTKRHYMFFYQFEPELRRMQRKRRTVPRKSVSQTVPSLKETAIR